MGKKEKGNLIRELLGIKKYIKSLEDPSDHKFFTEHEK